MNKQELIDFTRKSMDLNEQDQTVFLELIDRYYDAFLAVEPAMLLLLIGEVMHARAEQQHDCRLFHSMDTGFRALHALHKLVVEVHISHHLAPNGYDPKADNVGYSKEDDDDDDDDDDRMIRH